MMRINSVLPCALLLLSLSACAGTGSDYPSLAIRDAERVTGTYGVAPEDMPQTAPDPAPAGTSERLAQILSEARSAHGDFVALVPTAEQRVAAGAGSGIASDSWSRAQVALAQLDSARSRAAVPLGDLDLLYADATLAWQERDAISAARDEVTGLIAQEDATLARLRNRLGG